MGRGYLQVLACGCSLKVLILLVVGCLLTGCAVSCRVIFSLCFSGCCLRRMRRGILVAVGFRFPLLIFGCCCCCCCWQFDLTRPPPGGPSSPFACLLGHLNSPSVCMRTHLETDFHPPPWFPSSLGHILNGPAICPKVVV